MIVEKGKKQTSIVEDDLELDFKWVKFTSNPFFKKEKRIASDEPVTTKTCLSH